MLERLLGLVGRVSVRTKIMGIVLGLVALLGLGTTVWVHFTLQNTLRQQLELRGVSVTRDLAARSTDLLLTNNVFALHALVRDTVENNDDLRYAFLLDEQKKTVVHSFPRGVPDGLIEANLVSGNERVHVEVLETEEGLIWDFAVPVFGGRAGFARVGLSEQRLQSVIFTTTEQLLLVTVLVSILGIAAGYFLTLIITRPVLGLVQVTQAVTRGDLTQRAHFWAQDEIGTLSEAFNLMVEDLARERVRRSQLLDAVITAQEEERKRIARELHDETGQALTSLLVGLKVAAEADAPRHHLIELRAIAAQTLEGVRDLARELRPPLLDDLGLAAALERHSRQYGAKHGLTVDWQALRMDDGTALSPQLAMALYRIIQEALTNVVRHAQAKNVSVVVERKSQSVVAVVEDDGVGFSVSDVRIRDLGMECAENEQPGLGLFGMQERAALLGGTLNVESSPGQGTTIRVELPL